MKILILACSCAFEWWCGLCLLWIWGEMGLVGLDSIWKRIEFKWNFYSIFGPWVLLPGESSVGKPNLAFKLCCPCHLMRVQPWLCAKIVRTRLAWCLWSVSKCGERGEIVLSWKNQLSSPCGALLLSSRFQVQLLVEEVLWAFSLNFLEWEPDKAKLEKWTEHYFALALLSLCLPLRALVKPLWFIFACFWSLKTPFTCASISCQI